MGTSLSVLSFLLVFNSGAFAESSVSFDRKGALPVLSEDIKAPPPAVAGGGAAKSEAPGFCIFNGRSGSPLGAGAAFKTVVGESDVVFSGESHDQMKDHLAQLEALKALGEARGEKIAVGFEMLNMTLQPVLDDYAAGKLSEEEFLLKADWKKEWGFDFKLYKPLFDFVRENGLKALALNLPKKVVSKIARAGLAGLSPEEKQYLPAKVEITKDEAYIKYIRQSFEGHGPSKQPGGSAAGKVRSGTAAGRADKDFLRQYILGKGKKDMGDMFTFENYLAAMCAWNETMGARLADFLNANPGFAGLAVAGSGHVIYNAGIPTSVLSRTDGLRPVSFYPADAAACPAAFPADDAGLADYVWYIDHSSPAAPARSPAH
ncbi:MAG: ChaN family lipoprotein [Elusimicrobia bacterium]|nr:ChaN family lipoprotein [Elusimicrobiota bacterium]